MAAEVRFSLNEQDCVEAARAQFRRRFVSHRQWVMAFAALVGMSALVAYFDPCDLGLGIYLGAGFAGLVLLLCPFFAGAGYLLAGRFARRLFRQQNIHPESRMAWSDEGLKSENDLGSVFAKWHNFYGWREDRGSYTLLFNESIYYLIPARVMSAAQSEDLKDTLVRSGLTKR